MARNSLILFGGLFCLLFTSSARADIVTFIASGDFGPPAGPPVTDISFTGTISIDTTLGQVTAADITLGFQSPTTNVTFTGITPTETNPMGPTDIVLTGPGSDLFSFQVDASDLMGYPGGELLNAFLAGSLPEIGGDFTPASPPAAPYMLTPTPEPSGLGLLAGMLGCGLVLLHRRVFSVPMPSGAASGSKSTAGSSLLFSSFFLPAFGRCVRIEGMKKAIGCARYFVDSAEE